MNDIRDKFLQYPNYIKFLGEKQTIELLKQFVSIEAGQYNKHEEMSLNMAGFKQAIYLRCIRADMQSFVNTFIEGYLQQKP